MPTATRVPDAFLDLFTRPILAHLATLMPDGTPQVTPVWLDYDGQYLRVNTFCGRLKDRNMTARTQVGLDIVDPDDPFRYLSVRGRIVETTEEGAEEHIDTLSMKYLDAPYPRHDPNRPRKLFKIAVEHVVAQSRMGEAG